METSYRNKTANTSKLGSAALAYARRGMPVFPCEPGGKAPITRRGFYDATTDEAQIRAWWRRCPDANIGIPTGSRSGLLILDIDPDEGGQESLAVLEAKHDPLPRTTTARTGGGGEHRMFNHPPGEEIRCNVGTKLGPGLDIKAEGGYIIAPPSRTQRDYQWIEKAPATDAPEWLIKKLKEPAPRSGGGASGAGPVPDDGGPIREKRNIRMTSIGGRLHDGTKTLEELTDELLAVNAARCVEPLPEAEVRKIARSVYRYERSGGPRGGGGAPSREVLAAVESFDADMNRREWPGMGGKTRLSGVKVLIREARKHGALVERGIGVSLSRRQFRQLLRVARRTSDKVLDWLRDEGIIAFDLSEATGTKAGRIVLLVDRAGVGHSIARGSPSDSVGSRNSVRASGLPLRAPYSSPRFRWSAAGLARLGKGREAAVDYLEARDGWAEEAEIAAALGIKRARDCRRRNLDYLAEKGIAERSGTYWRLAADWQVALVAELEDEARRERKLYGVTADERDLRRDEEERQKRKLRYWLRRCGAEPDRAPTRREMDRRREERQLARAPEEPRRVVKLAASDRRSRRRRDMPEPAPLYAAYERKVWANIVRHRASVEAAERARAGPPGDWRDHPLVCECVECTSPDPAWARVGGVA